MNATSYLCRWFDANGKETWRQYHDETDPLPDSWDDVMPAITALYSADQALAHNEANESILKWTAKQERERCAKLADDEFGDLTVLGDGIYNQLGDAEKTAQNIAKAIRALGGE